MVEKVLANVGDDAIAELHAEMPAAINGDRRHQRGDSSNNHQCQQPARAFAFGKMLRGDHLVDGRADQPGEDKADRKAKHAHGDRHRKEHAIAPGIAEEAGGRTEVRGHEFSRCRSVTVRGTSGTAPPRAGRLQGLCRIGSRDVAKARGMLGQAAIARAGSRSLRHGKKDESRFIAKPDARRSGNDAPRVKVTRRAARIGRVSAAVLLAEDVLRLPGSLLIAIVTFA
jgi:hypothetical protein